MEVGEGCGDSQMCRWRVRVMRRSVREGSHNILGNYICSHFRVIHNV